MGFKNVCNGIKVDPSNYIAFSGLPNWLWGSPHINCPIFELTYSCHKLSMNFACMSPSQMPSRHESDCRCQKAGMLLYMHARAHTHTLSYLAWGTSMLEETTLRFCSSRDTDRVSGSRPARLPSAIRCSSNTSGMWEQPSTFWFSGAPLLELCWRGMQRRIS